MLDKAFNLGKKHQCSGIITMGDFNARHIIWNDSVNNKYGKCLEECLDWSKFGVYAPSSSTFLSKNGSSLIDVFITSNNLDYNLGTPFTDYKAILYSGAPVRGHVPVTITINPRCLQGAKKPEKKLDLSSMNWDNWTSDIEQTLWQVGRLAPDSLCTVPARSMQQQKNTPCTVPARSLHNEHLMHTPCTVSPCTLPARSMHGLCTVPAQ